MQINDSELLVTLEIAYLIYLVPLIMAPRCRRNVGLVTSTKPLAAILKKTA